MILGLDKTERDRLAVIDSDGNKLTYGEIVDFAKQLRDSLPQRTLCFMLVENTVECAKWVMAALASERLVPLILSLRTERVQLQELIDTYRPEYVFSPSEQLKPTGYGPCPLHEDLSHLLPTSGSTGSPKLVRHKYENIEASALNISTFFELKPSDRPLLVLPLFYTMGLSVMFSHCRVGATVLLTNRNMTDGEFWNFFKRERATSFTGVPYSFHILNLLRFFRMDLPDLELLTQGGGKMPAELNRKFAEFCRKRGMRWIATYGQSECTARMAYLPAKWACSKVGSIGIAVPNGELSLLDSDGNTITGCHIKGEMCYRGRNVTMGYAQKREDLILGDVNNGFIRTGDLAYRDEDGCYYVVGRLGRFLKLFGLRISLDECEQIVESIVGTDCACVGTDEKMIVYIVDKQMAERVKNALIEKTQLVATAFEIRVINMIPKNDTGKKMYQVLAES